MANPHSSGTAFMAIATLVHAVRRRQGVQVFERAAQEYQAVSARRYDAAKEHRAGKNSLSISFIHDVPGEVMAGFPLRAVMPCEGTGYEIGSMSIVKGARNIVNAKKFYDWALTVAAQELAAQAKQFQLPANMRAKVDLRVPDINKIKLIR